MYLNPSERTVPGSVPLQWDSHPVCAGAELRESQKTAGHFASALTCAPKMCVPTKGQVTNTEDK